MGEDLTARVKDVVTMRSDAMNMVAGSAKAAIAVRARFILHVLLKAVFGKRLVFNVVCFMFFCAMQKKYTFVILAKKTEFQKSVTI